ncbi:MAG: glycoside hydrolase [Phycisphaerae bacterium]|nr:glycoside hydrolase [Phycisphaerae bacterium]NIX30446.1 glycoside hydrolase [Phycisphaerae bacterium]
MIKKQFVKSRGVYKVTFAVPETELPEELEIDSLVVVGDFNDWDKTATPLKQNKEDIYKATIELEPGQDVQFRYLANGEHWFNAWEADEYIANQYGSDNCCIMLPEVSNGKK